MKSASAPVKRDLRQEVTDSIAALEKGVDPCVALTALGPVTQPFTIARCRPWARWPRQELP